LGLFTSFWSFFGLFTGHMQACKVLQGQQSQEHGNEATSDPSEQSAYESDHETAMSESFASEAIQAYRPSPFSGGILVPASSLVDTQSLYCGPTKLSTETQDSKVTQKKLLADWLHDFNARSCSSFVVLYQYAPAVSLSTATASRQH
jgi:hypothetical protein